MSLKSKWMLKVCWCVYWCMCLCSRNWVYSYGDDPRDDIMCALNSWSSVAGCCILKDKVIKMHMNTYLLYNYCTQMSEPVHDAQWENLWKKAVRSSSPPPHPPKGKPLKMMTGFCHPMGSQSDGHLFKKGRWIGDLHNSNSTPNGKTLIIFTY